MHLRHAFAPLTVFGLLVAVSASAQTTLTFNSNYPADPNDPEPRTASWDDGRNWGGSVPSSLDEVIVTEGPTLDGSATVASARFTDVTVSGTGGSLDVLGEFYADGTLVFFNAVTLRGQSQIGSVDTAGTNLGFFRDLDNYGDLTIASTHQTPIAMVGYGGGLPTLTNHAGATFTFGEQIIRADYGQIINATGATLTKAGLYEGSIVADNGGVRTFENHGQLNVEGGKLSLLSSAGDWDGGAVTLTSGSELFFSYGLPSGSVALDGTGRITASGGDLAGDLALNFAADSKITIDDFRPDRVDHNLTLDGPVTLRQISLNGTGLLTFKGTPTLDLHDVPGDLGVSATISNDVRNEGTLTILGGDERRGVASNAETKWTNTAGHTLALVDRVGLYGATTLYNDAGGIISQSGTGTSEVDWTFDHAGLLLVDSATLDVNAARNWSGDVTLRNDGRLRFQNVTPDGSTLVRGDGTVELASVTATQNFTLHYADTGAVRTLLNSVYLGADTILTIDGPTRLWGTIVGYSGEPDQRATAALELTGGVTLAAGDASPSMTIDAPVRSSGLVELDGTANLTVEATAWTNPATGTLHKTGANAFSFVGGFINQGTIDLEAGTLSLGTSTDWNAGSAIIAEGAQLILPDLPTGSAVLSGQGQFTITRDNTPLVLPADYALPTASDSRLTLIDTKLTGTGVFIVNNPLDFVQDELVFAGGIQLNATTFWGPRTGLAGLDNPVGLAGLVSNTSDATLRGTLYSGLAEAGSYDPAVALQPVTWENLEGSTFNLTGEGAARGKLLDRTDLSSNPQGAFVNHAGATFAAGFGGGEVDWSFQNQGTVRVNANDLLTLHDAGSWDGGRVELFQSYLKFTDHLPTGDITIVGPGDIGFGAAHRDDADANGSPHPAAPVAVPLAGTTLRFGVFDNSITGDLIGPGRLTLFGDRLQVNRFSNSGTDGGSGETAGYDSTFFAPSTANWANDGGIELHGNLLVTSGRSDYTPQTLSVSGSGGFDIYGALILSNAILITPAHGENSNPLEGRVVVKDGGTVAMNHGATMVGSGLGSARLVVESGGQVNLTNLDGSPIRAYFENHGTLNLRESHVVMDAAEDWSGGHVYFDPANGSSSITFSNLAPSTTTAPLTFTGPGHVQFENINPDGRTYVFQALNDSTQNPSIGFNDAFFQGNDATLNLQGNARFTDSLELRANVRTGPTVVLAGQFRLATNGGTFDLETPTVRNEGTVIVANDAPVTEIDYIAVRSRDNGGQWINATGSTFELHGGTDLQVVHDLSGATSGEAPHFFNEAEAHFVVSAAGPTANVVAWDFTNRGEIIARDFAHLSFVGNFVNASTGTLRTEDQSIIDFGPNSHVELTTQFSADGGTFSAGEFIVSASVSPNVTGSLHLASDSVTMQNNPTLNVGSADLAISGAINGTATIVAQNLVFSGGAQLNSTPGSTLTVQGNLNVADATVANFGAGSTLTVQGGSITGTGGLQADQIFVIGSSATTVAGGTLLVTANNLTLQNGATANFGASTVHFFTPLSGTGTFEAGQVSWTTGTFASTGPTALTFNSALRVFSGAEVNFGATSSIIVNGSLGGTGTVAAGTITVNGEVSPGSSPGTLALIGNTTFQSSSVFDFELGLAAQDLITVDGDLTLDGTINFVAMTDLVPGNYALFTFTGIFTDLGLHLGTVPTGFNATLFTDLSNFMVGVNLTTASAVPEPSTYAALMGALALGATLGRRRGRPRHAA